MIPQKITIEFNQRVKMWEAVHEYQNGEKVTIMDTELPRLAEAVLGHLTNPEGFFAK